MEELNLIRDMAVILISAGVFTIISKALKQPLVLGYIIAGFLIGPYVHFFPGISSTETVQQWAELGITFLMFGLGLEFSVKKLLKVGSTALATAGCKFLGGALVGFVLGHALGWTNMECIFLAGLLSMSSTIVVIKSYEDMKLKDKPYAGIVFGTLVVEDLIAILLMVFLSTIAVSREFQGADLLKKLGNLIFFIIICFLVGIYVIPTILKKARRFISDEILLIVSLGLCFGLVSLAIAAGFSTALGAFLMGTILAETTESERIEKLVGPIKDLFGAIFFVSVGMMVSPLAIAQNWLTIIVISIAVLLSDTIFASLGVLATGKGLDNAVHAGMSLSNLGEFGFIIAGVGVSLGVMNENLYPVIVAVSVLTTFTAPYMIKLSGPASRFLEEKLPASVVAKLQPQDELQHQSSAEKSEWKNLLKQYFLRIGLYGVVIIGISVLMNLVLDPLAVKYLGSWSETALEALSCVSTLVLMSPFLYGMELNPASINEPARKLIKEKNSNKWPVFGLVLLRSFIAIGIVLAVISSHFDLEWWAILLILFGGLYLLLMARRYMKRYSNFEDRFFHNLNQKEEDARLASPVASSIRGKLAGYDVHTEMIELSADSSYCGQKLRDPHFRVETGANIIKIVRGSRSIIIPGGDEVLYPGDKILAVGTPAQIKDLRKMFEDSTSGEAGNDPEFKVENFVLEKDSYLTGKQIKDLKMRDAHVMIISVLRGDDFITNPKPDFLFKENDAVWIAGEAQSLSWYR